MIGHRGARATEPENTIRSLRRAIECGADMVEIDVRLSKDGMPVVMHDEAVDRTTGDLVRGAYKHGIAVYPWVVNTEEEFLRVAAMGVDGVVSDHPCTVRGFVDTFDH